MLFLPTLCHGSIKPWEYILCFKLLFFFCVNVCVFIWQAKRSEQRERAKQVATFNLQMSEKNEKTCCPLFPVSRTWTLKWCY